MDGITTGFLIFLAGIVVYFAISDAVRAGVVKGMKEYHDSIREK